MRLPTVSQPLPGRYDPKIAVTASIPRRLRPAGPRALIRDALQRVSLWPRLVIGFTLGFVALFGVFTLLAVRSADASSRRIVDERRVIAEMAASDVQELLARSRATLAGEAETGRAYEQALRSLEPAAIALSEIDSGRIVRSAPPAAPVDRAAIGVAAVATRAGHFAISQPYRRRSGGAAVAVAYATRGRTLVLELDAGSTAFTRPLVEAKRLGKTGHGELVGAGGIVIASTDRGDALQPGEHLPFYRQMLGRRVSDVQTVQYFDPRHADDAGGGRHVMAWAPVRGAPWGVAVGGTVEDTFGPVHRLRRNLLIAGAAALAVLWLTALLGARLLVRPVHTLTRAARGMADGDLEQRISVVEGGEIGTLAESLESMRLQLRGSLQTVRRWGEELEGKVEERTSELAAVTAVATAASRTYDLPSMLDACLVAILDHTQVEGAAVRLVEPRSRRLGPARARGTMTGFSCTASPVAEACPCAEVADASAAHFGRSCTECVETASALAVLPLRARDRTIGVLTVANEAARPLSTDERRTLTAIADQLAVAVDNAGLLDELTRIEAQREVQKVKSELISAVSHELRTPLSFIKGYATTLLRDRTVDEETRTQFLEIIDEESGKLEVMVEDLLDASRLQSGRLEITLEEIDLASLVADVVARAAPQLGAREHEVRITSAGAARVLADPLRVEQIVENLLENAARYAPPTTPIDVSTRVDERFALLTVSDVGPGVSDEERERIFEPFYRGRAGRESRERGVGLGLAICLGLAEAQGGSLRLLDVAAGAAFELRLPLVN